MEEKRLFIGKIDQDTALTAIAEGDYYEAWNCISGKAFGYNGLLAGFPGFADKKYTFADGSTYKPVSIALDHENKKSYHFIYSSAPSYYMILEFDEIAKTYTLVWQNAHLAFPANWFPSYVINGYLIWSDNTNDIRQLNIEKAINTSSSPQGTPKYDTVNEQTIAFIKAPPKYRPICTYSQNTDLKYNNLRTNLFQFSYRYVYEDYSKSVLGPASDVPLPDGEEKINGLNDTDITVNNQILVEFEPGHDNVIKIECLMRIGNSGYWQLFDIIDMTTASLNGAGRYQSYFRNQGSETIDVDDSFRPFDYVPRQAKCFVIGEGNRPIFGNYKQGFSRVTPDVTLTPEYVQMSNNYMDRSELTVTETRFDYDQGTDSQEASYFTVTFPSSPVVGVEYIVNNVARDDSYAYTVQTGDTGNSVASALEALIDAEYAADEINGYAGSSGNNLILNNNQNQAREDNAWWDTVRVFGAGNVTDNTEKHKSLKIGAKGKFGIIYRDGYGRTAGVETNDSCIVEVPFYTDGTHTDIAAATITKLGYYCRLNYTISHLPPSWARSWQWVFFKSDVLWFDHFMVYAVEEADDPTAAKRIKIDINTIVMEGQERFPTYSLDTYSYVEGDRMRIVAKKNATTITWDLFSSYIDLPVVGYDEESNSILVENFDYGSIDFGNGSIVEIYRPDISPIESTEDFDLTGRQYYEIGEPRDCYQAGGTYYHKGETTDQNSINDADGTMDFGNTYQRVRSSGSRSYPVESRHFSDFYESDSVGIGRITTYEPDFVEKTYDQGLVYGGQFVNPHGKINNMSRFEYDSYDNTLPARYGPLYALIMKGDVLKAIQQNKVTSIYLGQKETRNPDGTSIIQATDSVLGYKKPSTYDYGTIFPESVHLHEGVIYFYDVYAGGIIAHTDGGSYRITDKGLSKHFKDWSNNMLTVGTSNFSVFITNDRYDNIFLFIKDNNDGTYSRGYVYDRSVEGIKSFLAWVPDVAYYFRDIHVFNGGDVYVADTTENYNTVFGTVQEMSAMVVINKEPMRDKVLLSVVIETNINERKEKDYTDGEILAMWSSKDKGDILIPATEQGISDKSTRIKALRYEHLDGKLVGTIPQDMNSVGPATEEDALLEGDDMRGRVAKIRIKNKNVNLVLLTSISCNYVFDR